MVKDSAELERDFFISQLMVGNCPNCGSNNTHDCEAPNFVSSPFESQEQVFKLGSECGIARELDDPTVGHCDDCNYIWCLDCGSELTLDRHICGHWKICDECGRESDFPSTCPYKEEADTGDLIVNPCLSCPSIYECSRCPYENNTIDCPKIIEWKQQNIKRK